MDLTNISQGNLLVVRCYYTEYSIHRDMMTGKYAYSTEWLPLAPEQVSRPCARVRGSGADGGIVRWT